MSFLKALVIILFCCIFIISCDNSQFTFGETRTPATRNYKPHLAVSISDDDTIDDFLRYSGSKRFNGSNGFFSRLYPVVQSLNAPVSESIECWRCGIDKDDLNNTGLAIKALCTQQGWEPVSHTMTARFRAAYLLDTFSQIKDLPSTPITGNIENTEVTHIYVKENNTNYYYSKDHQWLEVPDRYIKPKLMNFSGTKIADNPSFPIEYQLLGSKQKIEQIIGIPVHTFISPADSRGFRYYEYALQYYDYVVQALNTNDNSKYNITMPLESVIVELARGFFDLGSSDTNNEAGDELYDKWVSKFNSIKKTGTYSIIFGMHSYLPCWKNCIESQLVSNGGNYPDEFVTPVRDPREFPDDFLSPHPSTNLSDWGDWAMDKDGNISGHGWYPCPGTRLYQYWKFLLYIKSQGVPIMTIHDNLDRIKNVERHGYKIKPEFFDIYEDTDKSYYIVGADGSTISYTSKSEIEK